MQIRLIGDIHGRVGKYNSILMDEKDVDFTLQLGDMGFNSEYSWLIKYVDPIKHRMIMGNHDDYEYTPPHALGDFGLWNNIFFVRGAESIDRDYRTIGIDWWQDEQLSIETCNKALEMYSSVKPDIVCSHDCPSETAEFLFQIRQHSQTRQLLSAMFQEHQPKMWFFGHHHKNISTQLHGTLFRCLDEFCYFDIEI